MSEEATHHKGLGNTAFKAQNFSQAIDHYTDAIHLLESKDHSTPNVYDTTTISENLEDVRSHSHVHSHALAILYSNRAQAQLKLENYGLAIADCSKSLEHDSTFVKSLYRRAVASYAIRDLESALVDCKRALELAKGDVKIKGLSTQISKEIRTMRFEMAIDIVEKSVFCNVSWEDTKLGDDGRALQVEKVDEKSGDVKIVNGLNREFIQRMITKFKESDEGGRLNKYDALAIVNAANTLFKGEKSLVEVGFEECEGRTDYVHLKDVEKITVCGDTHGQFYDVLNIFQKFGDASDTHAYLFNGDFVDRGSWGCEVALLLYALKVLCPTRVFINRGNHETDDMNNVYGFRDECKFKYGEKLFKCFSESFGNLPYCTLINNDYLVMHGGLFSEDNVTLDDLRQINRFKQVNGQPPKTGLEMELIWTDPQFQEGRSLSKRGIGMQFGPDITRSFCDRNKLKGVIRSHEVRQNGYEWEHHGLLCTVFSAPNYCDSQGNMGAVLNFKPGTVKPDCQAFAAVEHPNIPPMKYTQNQFGF
jgi:serine/threonine-protein phosphatase 5